MWPNPQDLCKIFRKTNLSSPPPPPPPYAHVIRGLEMLVFRKILRASCGFGHIYWRNKSLMKNFIFCAVKVQVKFYSLQILPSYRNQSIDFQCSLSDYFMMVTLNFDVLKVHYQIWDNFWWLKALFKYWRMLFNSPWKLFSFLRYLTFSPAFSAK